MTTIAYRQVLERQRSNAIARQDYTTPLLTDTQIERMVNAYGKRREQSFAKRGLTRQRRLILALARDERRHIRRFTRELKQVFTELGDMAADAFRQVDELFMKQDEALPEEVEMTQAILRILNLRLWQSDTFVPSYERMVESIALGTVETINLQLRLGVNIPDHMMRAIVQQGGTRAGLLDVSKDTRQAIFRALFDGRELGEGPFGLADRIKSYVPEGRFRNAGAEYRARMIARTETKYAQNVSSIEAYRDSDVVTGLIAFDAQLGPTDADCEARDGKVFSFEDAARLSREEHPNGTLSWAPYIDDSLAEAA